MIGIHRCKINQLVHYQTTSIHIICNEVNLKALVTGIHTLETILFSGTKGGMRVMLLFHVGITNQIHGLLNPYPLLCSTLDLPCTCVGLKHWYSIKYVRARNI